MGVRLVSMIAKTGFKNSALRLDKFLQTRTKITVKSLATPMYRETLDRYRNILQDFSLIMVRDCCWVVACL